MKKKVLFIVTIIIFSIILLINYGNQKHANQIENKRIAKLPKEPSLEKDFKPLMNELDKKFKTIQVDACKLIGSKHIYNHIKYGASALTDFNVREDAIDVFEYYYLNHKNELLILKELIMQQGSKQVDPRAASELATRYNRTSYSVFYTYNGWIGREVLIWFTQLMVRLKDGQVAKESVYSSNVDHSVKPWLEAIGQNQGNDTDYRYVLVDCINNGCEEINYQTFKENVDNRKFKQLKTNYARMIYRENIDVSNHPVAINYRNRDKNQSYFYRENVWNKNNTPLDNKTLSLELIK